MWITPDGRFNTVALPEPREVLTPRALTGLMRLRDAVGAERIGAELEQAEASFLEPEFEPDADDAFVGVAPPVGLLDGEFDSLDALIEAVGRVPERWQLDILEALSDLNDQDYAGSSDLRVQLLPEAARLEQAAGDVVRQVAEAEGGAT